MIYLYPANKMENLLVLLDKIQQLSPLSVFDQEVIVVQNAGMQHWLNLSLAKQRGISMNKRYALPAQFLWKLMRTLASDEVVPDQSPYSREVLAWRIHALLASKTVVDDDDFRQATLYWQGNGLGNKPTNEPANQAEQEDSLKRYQLAGQLADLYEQYLIFRPEWIDAWAKGYFTAHSQYGQKTNKDDSTFAEGILWQGKLWQLLNQELPYNPLSLLENAISNIDKHLDILPKRLSFFGINTMAPMWLTFINALSEHIEVHFFHLNPCFSYWGDIVTEKQAYKQLSTWVDGVEDPQSFVGNPLLANLGQQGREFMSLLQDYSTVNIEAFESLDNEQGNNSNTALEQLQQDILTLTDTRIEPKTVIDDSIVITSCHSALREVQGLHDYLLHQFNNDSTLTPKDVLVMCPQIEHYAPYVNAVFARGWQDIGDAVPPLPCSIADRSAKDSEPLIAAFTELLTLPDSRFQVSQLMSFLRLPAMASKFDISHESLDKITVWLDQAAIHWGLDAEHKQQLLSASDNNHTNVKSNTSVKSNNNFTWQQGLSRLLRGFAFADSEVIYQDQLLLSTVEGSDAILLGKLMLIIEQLQLFSSKLLTPRSASQWQTFLLENIESLFVRENEASITIIEQAIASLVEYCSHAHYQQNIELTIVSDFLDHHFSQPDPGRQFMVGQVTFCSMLPMRSIPFKIIAVLGLNDGEFPRQRQPLGFDLMELSAVKLGDRSRRGDDRYLFLEALISARQALYLSFQGRNIKNNNEKQASLVLKELMEYLTLGFGWHFDSDSENKTSSAIRQLAMQAFSEKNYIGKWPSFDANWLALGQQKQTQNDARNDAVNSDANSTDNETAQLSDTDIESANLESTNLTSSDLIRFYQHPTKAYAQQHLQLYFDQQAINLDDSEPFKANGLETYLLRQQLLEAFLSLNTNSADESIVIEDVLEQARLSGKFPDLPTTAEHFQHLCTDSEQFSAEILQQNLAEPEYIDASLRLQFSENMTQQTAEKKAEQIAEQTTEQVVELTIKFPVKNNQLVFYRPSSAKAKDLFTLYLHQLMLQVYQDEQATLDISQHSDNAKILQTVQGTTGLYFDTKAQKVSQYQCLPIEDAKQHLRNVVQVFLQGQQQPLLLNGDLADTVFKSKKYAELGFSQAQFEQFWQGDFNTAGFGDDDYIHYFWPQCPEFSMHDPLLQLIYQPMYQVIEKLKLPSKAKTKSNNKGAK